MKEKYNYVRKTARYNGKKYEATGKTELEAMTKLAEKLAAAKRGEETIGGSMTVDAWFAQWLDTYKVPKGLIEHSLNGYRSMYTRYLHPRIGRLRLRDVRDVHLQKILNEQAGMSSSHVIRLRQVMQGMFRRARQSRLIAYDPAEMLELPESRTGRRRSLTDEERAALLAVADTHPAGLWALTLLYTGMRPGESAALRWVDVDFDHGEIHIHAAKEAGAMRIKAPKSAAGVRDIPIHAQLLPRLRAERGEAFDFVFPSRSGGMMSDNNMHRQWLSLAAGMAEQLGRAVDDLTPYFLRHTFCTDLQRAGVHINVVKELMGHSNIAVTANIYTHRDQSVLHAGIALLDGTATSTPVENAVGK